MDKFAQDWWDPKGPAAYLRGLTAPRFEYFDRFMLNWTAKKVLVIGCGGGFSSEYLAEQGADVTAIDASAVLLAVAQDRMKGRDYSVDYQQKMPVGENLFDAVICLDVLIHTSNAPQLITQILRLLKPGGYFFFDAVNKTWWSRFKKFPKEFYDWEQFVKPEFVQAMLETAGFKQIEMRGLSVKRKDRNSDRLQANIHHSLLAMYVGKAQKKVPKY